MKRTYSQQEACELRDQADRRSVRSRRWVAGLALGGAAGAIVAGAVAPTNSEAVWIGDASIVTTAAAGAAAIRRQASSDAGRTFGESINRRQLPMPSPRAHGLRAGISTLPSATVGVTIGLGIGGELPPDGAGGIAVALSCAALLGYAYTATRQDDFTRDTIMLRNIAFDENRRYLSEHPTSDQPVQ